MTNFGIPNFPFSKNLMQKIDVLGMQISPFGCRRQEKYLNPKLTSFQIMKYASIWSIKGKVGSKNMDFLKFWNWQMLCWTIMPFFTNQHLSIFPFQ